MLVVIACMSDKFNNLEGRLVGQSLPQTGHQSADYGRRERGAHAAGNHASATDDASRSTYGYNVRFDATILSRTNTAKRSDALCLVVRDGANGQYLISIGRYTNLLPGTHA